MNEKPLDGGDETINDAGTPPASVAARLARKNKIDAQHLPVIQPTAKQLQKGFRVRDRLLAEELLAPISKQFPMVSRIMEERDALKIQVTELEIKVTVFTELELAHKGAIAEIEKLHGVIGALRAENDKLNTKK
jgi:hypothetical protein